MWLRIPWHCCHRKIKPKKDWSQHTANELTGNNEQSHSNKGFRFSSWWQEVFFLDKLQPDKVLLDTARHVFHLMSTSKKFLFFNKVREWSHRSRSHRRLKIHPQGRADRTVFKWAASRIFNPAKPHQWHACQNGNKSYLQENCGTCNIPISFLTFPCSWLTGYTNVLTDGTSICGSKTRSTFGKFKTIK